MSAGASVVIHGLDALMAANKEIANVAHSPWAGEAFLAGVRVIQGEAKERAPVGAHVNYTSLRGRTAKRFKGVSWVAGTLKRAIIAWSGKSPAAKGARAYTKVNAKARWGKVRAPHAVLVIGGVRARTAKKQRMVWPDSEGRWVFARRVKAIPARPFIEEAAHAGESKALTVASGELGRIIEREWNR